jgi:hypothetical protein
VGWLLNELDTMLPNRFRYEFLENMPENEAIELGNNLPGTLSVIIFPPFYFLRTRREDKDNLPGTFFAAAVAANSTIGTTEGIKKGGQENLIK